MSAKPKPLTEIDDALRSWSQGDFALTQSGFVHLADLRRPLTNEAREAAKAFADDGELGLESVFSTVAGLVVVSQTCDVVRSAAKRPYVEVSPLVKVDATTLGEIRKRRRPAFAVVPSLLSKGIVVDLDRTMTVEKSVVAGWERNEGCRTDQERRAFSTALARKRARYPFPDAFAAVVARFRDAAKAAHKAGTEEGAHIEALTEIRVLAEPGWEDAKPKLTFYFFYEDDPAGFAPNWSAWVEAWGNALTPDGFVFGTALAVTLDDLTARDYFDSVELDLEAVSPPLE